MAAFLVLTDYYYPMASSNGVCAGNIAKQLISEDDQVVVLAMYGEAVSKYGETAISLHLTKKPVDMERILHGLFDRPEMAEALFEKAVELHKDNHFAGVISFYHPIESVICGKKLHDVCGVFHFPCFFDIPETMLKVTSFKTGVLKKIVSFNYRRLYHSLLKDGPLLVMKYYKDKFVKFVVPWKRKDLRYAGVPSLNVVQLPKPDRQRIDLVYTGSFYEDIRNPDKVLDFLRCIIGHDIYLHLYSWNCEDVVEKYVPIYGKQLVVHGRVDAGEVADIQKNANVLVNISNDCEFQVPGKIMEYFSMGKPIINFRFRKDDCGNVEYDRYPCIFNVDLFKENSAQECVRFIMDHANMVEDVQKIKALFYDSTPEYFVQTIKAAMQE